jgi:hypothetical protein
MDFNKSFVDLSVRLCVPLWLNLIHLTTKDHEVIHKVTQRKKAKRIYFFNRLKG